MVLGLGNDDLIPGVDIGGAPRTCHQVERFGGVPGEDDFVGRRSADEPCEFLPSRLVEFRRT